MLDSLYPHSYPVFVIVGSVTATGFQFAVNVTVPLVFLKFLKYVATAFVFGSVHFVPSNALLPYSAVVVFKLLSAVHPANVCALLTLSALNAPLALFVMFTLNSFVGLSIFSIFPYSNTSLFLSSPPFVSYTTV